MCHYIPSYMKEVTWLKLCPGTNGHRSAAMEWLPFILPPVSSIGRVFRPPLRSEEENGGPSASGGHLGWPHFRFPQMRSPKMATGSGGAAIFLLTPQWGSKNAPQVLDDVISGAAILDSRWRWWKWRLEDVETPVKTSYRRLPHPWVL